MFCKKCVKVFLILLISGAENYSYADKNISDDTVAKLLIQEAIDNYSGRCPCPYNVMKNGKSCGNRSAYTKPGGFSPFCFRSDITPGMIQEWRTNHVNR